MQHLNELVSMGVQRDVDIILSVINELSNSLQSIEYDSHMHSFTVSILGINTTLVSKLPGQVSLTLSITN
jgi:hypothetical protein